MQNKNIFLLAILFVVSFYLIGCKKLSPSPIGLIVGNWLTKSQRVETISYNVITSDTTYHYSNDILALASDEHWSSPCCSGTYTFIGNILTLNFTPYSPTQVSYATVLSNDSLVLNDTVSMQGGTYRINIETYTK